MFTDMDGVQKLEQSVTDALAASRVLPVVVIDDAAAAAPLARALLAGGARAVEITLRTPAALAAVEAMATEPALLVGAGTVTSPGQVDDVVGAGARFVVTPGFSAAVVGRCQELGVPVYPGIATATELQAATEAGLRVVKFFPAELLGGAKMIGALAAPFRGVRFIPTGGVTTANLRDYLSVAAVLAVGGTWLAPAPLLAAGRFDEITDLTSAALAAATPAHNA
jgi:2-dehydro-3-deoxyphosphogluconate aldolase/(4S)-4-hydroxy-2-oxoglutarate aldolase